MENNKTSLTNFIKFVEDNNLVSMRLLNTLKITDGSIYDHFAEKEVEDITEIEDKLFLSMRNAGKISLAEFKKLRIYYLQNIHSITFEEIPRKEFKCWLRSDIFSTLKTIKDERDFVETAFLEKFKRESIKLVE